MFAWIISDLKQVLTDKHHNKQPTEKWWNWLFQLFNNKQNSFIELNYHVFLFLFHGEINYKFMQGTYV